MCLNFPIIILERKREVAIRVRDKQTITSETSLKKETK